MLIVKIEAFDNGGHDNQTINTVIAIPSGWALVPDNMVCENFPFGTLTAEEINGVMTVTSWVPGIIPELEDVEAEPTQLDKIEAQVTYTAMMTDTLLEV
jgi:hypothetical protein